MIVLGEFYIMCPTFTGFGHDCSLDFHTCVLLSNTWIISCGSGQKVFTSWSVALKRKRALTLLILVAGVLSHFHVLTSSLSRSTLMFVQDKLTASARGSLILMVFVGNYIMGDPSVPSWYGIQGTYHDLPKPFWGMGQTAYWFFHHFMEQEVRPFLCLRGRVFCYSVGYLYP